MELSFLGTGSAELYPALWCNCDYCTYARQHGGKNLRQTASLHFADKCLIDFPADIAMKAAKYNIDLMETELVLCTHSHEDHCNPQLLNWRYMPHEARGCTADNAPNVVSFRYNDLPQMHIFGNRCVLQKFKRVWADQPMDAFRMDFSLTEYFREYSAAGVDFIPMEAEHPDENGEKGTIYLVHAQGKTFLYATDTDCFTERTRDCIVHHKIDMAILDATTGLEYRCPQRHMDLARAQQEAQFLIDKGVFNGKPQVYLTHMSPHRMPPHDLLCDMLKGSCVQPAWDGLRLEL